MIASPVFSKPMTFSKNLPSKRWLHKNFVCLFCNDANSPTFAGDLCFFASSPALPLFMSTINIEYLNSIKTMISNVDSIYIM